MFMVYDIDDCAVDCIGVCDNEYNNKLLGEEAAKAGDYEDPSVHVLLPHHRRSRGLGQAAQGSGGQGVGVTEKLTRELSKTRK